MKNKTLVVWAFLITALAIGAFLLSFSELNGWMMIGTEMYKTAALAIGPVMGIIIVVGGAAIAFTGIASATACLSAVVALGIMVVAFTSFAGLMTGFAIIVVLVIGCAGYYLIKSTITDNESKNSIILLNIVEIMVIIGSLSVIIFNS